MNEFCIEWLKGDKYAGVSVPAGALKNKILRFSEKHPEEVKVDAINKDGSACFRIPLSYIKISPPRKLSEKQREAAGERFRKMWAEKKGEE